MAGNSKNIIKHWLKKCVFIIIIFICSNIIIYFVQLYKIKKYPVKVIKRKYTQDFFVNRHKDYNEMLLLERFKFAQQILAEEMNNLNLENYVNIVVDDSIEKEDLDITAEYNAETNTIVVMKTTLEDCDYDEFVNTVLHEVFHVYQKYLCEKYNDVITREELSDSEIYMIDVLNNESEGIYIDELNKLLEKTKDLYQVQYYNSLTEWSARDYADTRLKFYLEESDSQSQAIPDIIVTKWLNSIPH